MARWDAAGTLTWSLPVIKGPPAVAIGAGGVVHAAQDSPYTDAMDVARFAPDGSALPLIEFYMGLYHGMIAVDGAGQLMGTSSGHSSVAFETAAFSDVLSTNDADWVPTGIAGAGTGDVLWVYQPSDMSWPATAWSAHRYTAAGALLWSLARDATSVPLFGPVGATPLDLAAGPDGQLAVGGTYTGLTYTGGWIQTFAP
jgi:hypothetical protein